MAIPPPPLARDLRIDFFRGLALLMILVDHVYTNINQQYANPYQRVTLNAFAFNNGFEVFIFLSGFTAALVYGHRLRAKGALHAMATLYRRVWQIYAAQLLTFALYVVEVRYVGLSLHDPSYVHSMRMDDFTNSPYHAVGEVLILMMQPNFLDILPLYIVLLAGFPLVLFLQQRNPYLPLLLSGLVYLSATHFGWTFYPESWTFNPLCLQFLFVIGATAGNRQLNQGPTQSWEAPVAWVALGIAVLCAIFRLSWTAHSFYYSVPAFFYSFISPYWEQKSNLGWPRLLNLICLAVAALYFIRPDRAFLRSRWARPVILCGRQSLYIFCVGILVSILAHLWAQRWGGTLAAFTTVDVAGVSVLIGTAMLIDRFRTFTAAPSRVAARPAPQMVRTIAIRHRNTDVASVEYPGQSH